ncbi:MAG: tRNA pseudouridine(38-40) synthase TruA [Saprospirales bacterium]|nr:tRNA pseudouridine(38-40) synthase TruA [Saprospirales bacterium]MBK8491664.1 tRNA pseudouridine(38-40) synthase TruA [Saprospirales bacterium]
MRYFAEIAYRGTRYLGWQKQPEQGPTVQGTIENHLSTILGADIELVGCGRTDTGVHAREYVLHFDYDGAFPEGFLPRLNKFLPDDIAFRKLYPVHAEAHARFDAVERSYEYIIDLSKNPFATDLAYFFPFGARLDINLLQEAARLLLQYESFYPFCKSHTDAHTMRCDLKQAEWRHDTDADRLHFFITSNRFLRGMVRLLVGMCLNVGMGQVALDDVRKALDTQTRLEKSWSVPPEGLYLMGIRYGEMPG